MMNRLRSFMYGRYGTDQLSCALLVLYIALMLLSYIKPLGFMSVLAVAVALICAARILSRNIDARRRENRLFMEKWGPFQAKLSSLYSMAKDREHRYFTCSGCRNTLRVPRGKGKIEITCPRCGAKLVKKT